MVSMFDLCLQALIPSYNRTDNFLFRTSSSVEANAFYDSQQISFKVFRSYLSCAYTCNIN